MHNPFTDTQMSRPQESRFDLSHDIKTTFDMGKLIPTMLLECMPGDNWSIQIENFGRMQPLIAPPMHHVIWITDLYFIPLRILWANFQKFIAGEGDHLWPHMDLPEIEVGDLGDYLGLPVGYIEDTYTEQVSVLPIAAYLKIYDDWYRDQNLAEEVFIEVVDGSNPDYVPATLASPQRRAWMHDYFTSALPFAQKGDAVTLPVTDEGQLTVERLDNVGSLRPVFRRVDTNVNSPVGSVVTTATAIRTDAASIDLYYDPMGTMYVDVNDQAVTINSFRRAIRLQEFLERDARGGTRYIEVVKSHFGVTSSDARFQRPEFIGRAKQSMVISEVLSQAETLNSTNEIQTVVGDMAGHGISVGGSRNFRFFCEEHGYIMAITNVQPTTAYGQGIDKHWLRKDRLDYPWPTFAALGEQEIQIRELYVEGSVDGDKLFGYIPRYSEMRFQNSKVTGDLRIGQALDYWAWTREFETEPLLNQEFINCVPRTDMFAVDSPDARHIIAHMIYNVTVDRKLPKHGIPTI
nr:MAG: major capsid protein [Microvirus sp.]